MGFQSLSFSMEGRIGRGTYWVGLIGIAVVSFVAGLILWRIFGERVILTGGGRFAQFVVVMALLYPGYCAMAKRFQDRKWSGLATSGRSVVTSRLYQGPRPCASIGCAPIGKPPLLPDDGDGKIAWPDQHRAAMAKSEPAAQAPPRHGAALGETPCAC